MLPGQRDLHRQVVVSNARGVVQATPGERYAYVCLSGAPQGALVRMSAEDVQKHFDEESEGVRWLLRQMHTYRTDSQAVIGTAFGRSAVLSDVVWVADARRGGRGE